jgi:hypothetical protein
MREAKEEKLSQGQKQGVDRIEFQRSACLALSITAHEGESGSKTPYQAPKRNIKKAI